VSTINRSSTWIIHALKFRMDKQRVRLVFAPSPPLLWVVAIPLTAGRFLKRGTKWFNPLHIYNDQTRQPMERDAGLPRGSTDGIVVQPLPCLVGQPLVSIVSMTVCGEDGNREPEMLRAFVV